MELTIGERIGDLIAEKGISNKELAKQTGINPSTISEIISDVKAKDGSGKGFSYKYFIEIAKYFNVSTDYLFGLTDVKTTNTDIKSVCDYTGLSEKSVRCLLKMKNESVINSQDKGFAELDSFLDLLNCFIEPIKPTDQIIFDVFNIKMRSKALLESLLEIKNNHDYKNKSFLKEMLFSLNSFKYSLSKRFDILIDEFAISDESFSVTDFNKMINEYLGDNNG